jgi:ABC-type spermidine/putrescine transport system permease subunit I
LLHNRLAVLIGMVHFVLPYAIFPIYTSMREIDGRLENAARSMGAGTAEVIWHVILPLIVPGIAAAALLVFIVSTGFFITPVILGSPSDMMISNLVDYYVHELINFNNAAALAVLVALVLAPVVVLQQRVGKRGQYGVG